MARGIPSETQSFIRTHIRSIRQLEALLWLREHPGPISASDLAKEERLDPAMADDILRGFERGGFLLGPDDNGAYRYEPNPPELRPQVDTLADVYGTYRVSVINFVFTMPSESVQSFADAFKIRQEDDDS